MSEEPGYREIPPHVDFPAMDRRVLAWWAQRDVFNRSLEQNRDGPQWVFYEGPPTANGTPGTHHVEARVFKDVFPRYKTMRGYHVPRRAGWDCHGLPVELAVERELGLTGKRDIETFGVAAFNELCRDSVRRYVSEFAEMTERMGYWVDLDNAYWTMAPEYVESVWWSLKQIFDAGLLVEDYRVTPYCPRCGTGLSEHEVAQGYEDVADPSIVVEFPIAAGPLPDSFPDIAYLVWTTTPWTLVSNTALAVNPDAEYSIVKTPAGRHVVVATNLVGSVIPGEREVVRTGILGAELVGTGYRRPFDFVDIPDAHRTLAAPFVTVTEGTGVVHLAPAFGDDDLAVCRAAGLPVVNPVCPDGTFAADVPLVGGEFFKDADSRLVDDLRERGLIWRSSTCEHAYPHCWRCHTPLMYYAQPSWYIRTTSVANRLLDANDKTEWHPNTIKWGRYGDWLRNNVDWSLSRNRFWGTPLPIWRCEEGHLTCVGSRAELSRLAGEDLADLDPHRPFVDDISWPCPHCGTIARRVPQVIDCWYDSGAMPFAQWGYPADNRERFSENYPADFICEAIDQTRGWFYTLMAVGVLVFDESPYRQVLCLGHILDEDGRKMSKHLGNVLEPIPLMDRHGADAVRWFMLAAGSPWQGRRLGHRTIEEAARTTLRTLWSTASFLSLYGRIADFDPADSRIPPSSQRHILDRWALARLHGLIEHVEVALDDFDTQRAGRLLVSAVDDLSNWYVRRSRRRFWDGDLAALSTLHECIRVITQLMAPFTPFITERIWSDVVASAEPRAAESVHLSRWPVADGSRVDQGLLDQMALVRRLVELGRAARSSSRTKTRQPLSRGLVGASGWERLSSEALSELREELNVLTLEPLAAAGGELVDVAAKANFRSLGRRWGKRTNVVAQAIAATDPLILRDRLAVEGTAEVAVGGETVTLLPEDVVLTQSPRAGWSVASAHGETVALALDLTPELKALGIVREAVRFIQLARKTKGLEVTDRISVRWTAPSDVAAALDAHRSVIAAEVLAVAFDRVSELASPVTAPELDLQVEVLRAPRP